MGVERALSVGPCAGGLMRGRGGGEVNVMPLLQRLWKGGREQGERGWREGGSGVRGQPEQASAASLIGGASLW